MKYVVCCFCGDKRSASFGWLLDTTLDHSVNTWPLVEVGEILLIPSRDLGLPKRIKRSVSSQLCSALHSASQICMNFFLSCVLVWRFKT